MTEKEIWCSCGNKTEYGTFVDSDGIININSCCGGGCWAVENIKYCPFCGKEFNNWIKKD